VTARTADVLDTARQLAGLSLAQLWFSYIVLGGSATLVEVGDFLSGDVEPSPHEYDVLVQAINDEFVGQGGDHPVPYADERE